MSAYVVSNRCHVLMVIKPLSFNKSNLVKLFQLSQVSFDADEDIVLTTFITTCPLELDLFPRGVVSQHWVRAANGQHKMGVHKCGQRYPMLLAWLRVTPTVPSITDDFEDSGLNTACSGNYPDAFAKTSTWPSRRPLMKCEGWRLHHNGFF